MKIIETLTKEKVERNSETLELASGEFLYYDFSKSHMAEDDREEIRGKILSNGFESRVEGMLQGENINTTESRPVLHHLLRDEDVLQQVERILSSKGSAKRAATPGGVVDNAKEEIAEELVKIARFSEAFGSMRGVTDRPLDTVVNIGIGGSDLGPRMVADALQFYAGGRKVFFISNIDPSDTVKVFKKIDVERTLFIVVSKTFTTVETMENFKLALGLAKSRLNNRFSSEEICSRHFVAVSSNVSEAAGYGIKTVFKMWDFVGGRYSLWSAVGLSISLYIGFGNYVRLLRGASEADRDFFSRGLDAISSRMAINEVFYISRGFNNKCLVCYDSYLELLYKYLQQAEMESNGKHGSKQMIIWGGVGTDAQHSFFQLLHQGEQDVYLELLCPITNISQEETDGAVAANIGMVKHHQQLLAASCFAQSRSMLVGRESDDTNHYFAGDRPSVTVLYSKLTPEVLGAILAIYEHKILVVGVYFGINSFDQFGVELGKALTKELMKELAGEASASPDASTSRLLSFMKKN